MGARAERDGRKRAYPMKAAITLPPNTAAVLDANGRLTTVADGGATATSAGVTTLGADNSAGANDAIRGEVVAGAHKLVNSGDITIAHVGDTAYFVDADTVSISHATNTRAAAGAIIQVDDDGVWVKLGV